MNNSAIPLAVCGALAVLMFAFCAPLCAKEEEAVDFIGSLNEISAKASLMAVLPDLENRRASGVIESIRTAIDFLERTRTYPDGWERQFGKKRQVLGKLWLQYARTVAYHVERGRTDRLREIAAWEVNRTDRLVYMNSKEKNQRLVYDALVKSIGYLHQFPKDWAYGFAQLDYAIYVKTASRLPGNLASGISPDDALEASIVANLEALSVLPERSYPREYAMAQRNLANAYWFRTRGNEAENVERAITALEASLRVKAEFDDPQGRAETNLMYAVALYERLRGDKTANVRRAIQAVQDALTFATPEVSPTLNLRSNKLLLRCYASLREFDNASRAAFLAANVADQLIGAGFEDPETRKALSEVFGLHTEGAYALAALGRPQEALRFYDRGKARLLASFLAVDRLDLTVAEKERLRSLRRLVAQLGRSADVDTQAKRDLTRARFEASTLTLKGAGGNTSKPLSYPDRYVVVPVVSDNGLLFIVSEPGARISVVDDPNWRGKRPLEQLIDVANDVLSRIGQRGLYVTSLNRMTLAASPWSAYLETALRSVPRNARVTFIVDWPVSYVPLAAMPLGPNRRPLAEKYVINQAVSFSALAASIAATKNGQHPSLARIEAPEDLPAAQLETRAIGRFFKDKSQVWTDDPTAALPGRSHWHLAGHARFDRNDSYDTKLLFSSKRTLSLARIRTSLIGPPPRLVVLSACETGATDNSAMQNELIGLPTSFLQLGAAGVVATLWPVVDVSTALLMDKFYEEHIENERPPAFALREAQMWLANSDGIALAARLDRMRSAESPDASESLRNDQQRLADAGSARPFADEYYWGAFFLIGE